MTRPLYRFWLYLLLALALGWGEHAALWHDLGHAFKRLDAPAQQQSPISDTCDKCSAFASFAGALPSAAHSVPVVPTPQGISTAVAIPAPARTVVFARIRAPPAIS